MCACLCVHTYVCIFDVIVYRIGLLQFVLTHDHCPAGEIKKILQILRTTETADLYQQCTSTLSNYAVSGDHYIELFYILPTAIDYW